MKLLEPLTPVPNNKTKPGSEHRTQAEKKGTKEILMILV
jgi:hypothetical protein